MRKVGVDCETPSVQTNFNRIIDCRITADPASGLSKKPGASTIPCSATVVNGVDVRGIGNGGSTAQAFTFKPEIANTSTLAGSGYTRDYGS